MPLREEFRHSGNWLFRWRSYLPLVVLVPVLVAMTTSYSYPGGSPRAAILYEALCFVVSLLGLAVRIAAVGCGTYRLAHRLAAAGAMGWPSTVTSPMRYAWYPSSTFVTRIAAEGGASKVRTASRGTIEYLRGG